MEEARVTLLVVSWEKAAMLGERSIKSDTGRRAGGVFPESTEQVREGRLSKMRL